MSALETPTNPRGLGVPAGAISRAAAFCTDLLITSICISMASVFLDSLGIVFSFIPNDVVNATVGYLAAGFTFFVVYCAISWTLFGQTIGKLLFGLRVVRPDGSNPKLIRSFVRAMAYALSAILCIGFAMVLVTRDRRALHDLIARTYVVYGWRAQPSEGLEFETLEPLPPETVKRRAQR